MSKAQLKHALIDVNFKDKPKILELEAEFNPIARLFFIDILCALSAATNGVLSRGAAKILGSRCGFTSDQANAILDFCISREMLTALDDNTITNSRVQKDIEAYNKKLERDVNYYQAKKRRIVNELDNETNNEKTKNLVFVSDLDLKNNSQKISEPEDFKKIMGIPIPEKLFHPDLPKAFKIWNDNLSRKNPNLAKNAGNIELIFMDAIRQKVTADQFLSLVLRAGSSTWHSLQWQNLNEQPPKFSQKHENTRSSNVPTDTIKKLDEDAKNKASPDVAKKFLTKILQQMPKKNMGAA